MKQLLLRSYPAIDGTYGGAVLVYSVNADGVMKQSQALDLGGSDGVRGKTIRELMDAAPVWVEPVAPDA